MKKLILITKTLIFILLFPSCKKESTVDNNQKNKVELNKAIMSLKTPDSRKTVFADELSNQEKIYFLESRLNSLKEDFNLNDNQQEVINDLYQFLKPELYVIGSDLNVKAIKYTTEWREKAMKVFTSDQLSYIFSFKSFKEYTNTIKSTQNANETMKKTAVLDCDCSVKSDWCSGNFVCEGIIPCAFQSYACGTLYIFHCDGYCIAAW